MREEVAAELTAAFKALDLELARRCGDVAYELAVCHLSLGAVMLAELGFPLEEVLAAACVSHGRALERDPRRLD